MSSSNDKAVPKPLSALKVYLHKSIPHLHKREPIWRKQLENLGATLISTPSSPDVTHIVAHDGDSSCALPPATPHVRLVTEAWLQQCIQSKKRVLEDAYLLGQPDATPARESATKRQKTEHAEPPPSIALQEHRPAAVSEPSPPPPVAIRRFVPAPGVDENQLASAASALIRCVTYNILADKYARSGRTHSFCPAPLRAWSSRWPRLQDELRQYNSDLYCLQEVDEHLFHRDFQPFLQALGYASIFLSRGYGRKASKGVVEGIALVYKGSRFSCRHSSTCRFAERAPDGGGGADAVWQAVKTKEEGAVLALLELRSTGQLLLAASTHLWYDPQWPDLKVAQAHILCHEIAAFLGRHASGRAIPVILGGDFNSLWRKYHSDQFDQVPPGADWVMSGVYTLLAHGSLDSSHPHHPHQRSRPTLDPLALRELTFTTAGLQLRSAFLEARGHEPPITNKHAAFAGCLDYVWFTPATLKVVETLSLPYEYEPDSSPQAVRFPPIPNEVWPSDHLAIGATFQLLPASEGGGDYSDEGGGGRGGQGTD